MEKLIYSHACTYFDLTKYSIWRTVGSQDGVEETGIFVIMKLAMQRLIPLFQLIPR